MVTVSKYLQVRLQNIWSQLRESCQKEVSAVDTCFSRQTVKLLPAFVSDVIAFSDQLLAQFESPYIQVSLRSCLMSLTIDWSFSRERLSHQPLERTGDYALDPTYRSTQVGEEPPRKTLLVMQPAPQPIWSCHSQHPSLTLPSQVSWKLLEIKLNCKAQIQHFDLICQISLSNEAIKFLAHANSWRAKNHCFPK